MTTATPEDDPLLQGLVELGNGLPFNRHLGVEVVAIEPGRLRGAFAAPSRSAWPVRWDR